MSLAVGSYGGGGSYERGTPVQTQHGGMPLNLTGELAKSLPGRSMPGSGNVGCNAQGEVT